MINSRNNLTGKGIQKLKKYLPDGDWSLELIESGYTLGKTQCQGLKIIGPTDDSIIINLVIRKRLQPRDVLLLATSIKHEPCDVLLVISPYLSRSVCSALRDEGINYLDLTGNLSLRIKNPLIWIEATGAMQNPDRKERSARSLKGSKASRIVQVLAERKNLPNVRELASEAKTDVGYVSRVLKFLDEQALVVRSRTGRLESIDWEKLLRRLANDSPLESRGEIQTFIEPRGLNELMKKLRGVQLNYAVTGSLVAGQRGPVAPSRLAMIYVEKLDQAAKSLGLRQVDAGVNVVLIQPVDAWVFQRAERNNSIVYASFSQAIVDLLTSPGRGPAEAEALIEWMKENEDAWRR